ncbi:MAG: hypothetical protein RSE13_24155 [Planktothrix sp. GU0601_MAG3]|nr:MAG: hypothetical protein RSE13_24155 [Planktothrix sp. GU0601_MAG3]
MAIVLRGKDNDSLLAEIDAAYQQWIRLAVAPRDALMHYQDSKSCWHFLPEESAEIQTHWISDGKGNEYGFGIATIGEYVREFYQLADRTLLLLSTRLPCQLERRSK